MTDRPRKAVVEATDAAADALEDDELALVARRMMSRALSVCEEVYRHGTMAQKLELTKSVMGSIGRALGDRGDDKTKSELREQMADIAKTMGL